MRSDPQSVFSAFADAEKMSQFWFNRRDNGLIPGESVTWFLGRADDAPSFEVAVVEVLPPKRIVIDWADVDGTVTRVSWTMEETSSGDTLLTVVESGFHGAQDEIVAKALNSTGGFNQVILAAKALIEHGVAINVVADHP
ncbi:MAG: SRPBCC domain-containing protein [Pseudomonadota bacterium]